MLRELYLQNFRCFEKHFFELKPTSVIVGTNNAGKSTAIEALRILSLVMNRYGSLNFLNVPDWLIDSDMSIMHRGVSPSLRGIEFNTLSIFHNLGIHPALIRGIFESGITVEIYIGPKGALHAIVKDQEQIPVSNKSKAQKIEMPKINILPQIEPLSKSEQILDPDYVRSVTATSWASQHFRNQLLLYPEYFEEFKKLAETTWPNLKILGLEKRSNNPHEPLAFFIQDHEFVAEVSWMGHGLQMWLQTMWFLARSKDSATIILDEPDVYMHADLQRKLIRILKGMNRQVIVATHSVEIMAEVEAQDVLVINRLSPESVYASSMPSVQKVIDNIGGIHNIQLARLWNSQKCLFVEGKDVAFFKAAQNILFPNSHEVIDTIPNIQIGGWGGWNYALGSKLLLRNAVGESIRAYCIFDSDFHTKDEIEDRYKQAEERDIQLHIWDKKEIENYFIVPNVIQRIIEKGAKNKVLPTIEEITEQINIFAEMQKDSVFDALSSYFHAQDRAGGVAMANKKAREKIDTAWYTQENRWSIISGKQIISNLSGWSQQNYGVSFNSLKIIKESMRYEIDSEVRHVISAIEKGSLLTNPYKE